jgi:hypothetical protein
MINASFRQQPLGQSHDWRDNARSVLEVAQVAASVGVIVAVASHLAGAPDALQAWFSAGAAGAFVLLRAVRAV